MTTIETEMALLSQLTPCNAWQRRYLMFSATTEAHSPAAPEPIDRLALQQAVGSLPPRNLRIEIGAKNTSKLLPF